MFLAVLSSLLAASASASAARIILRQELADPPAPGEPVPYATVIGPNGVPGDLLPFHLGVEFDCPEPGGGRQLLLSIADTVRLADASNLPSPQTLRLDVPLRQLQWLQPAKACRELPPARQPVPGESVRYIRLRARALAFATLTCSGPSGQTHMSMASVPLDVWLGCEPPDADSASSAPPGITPPAADAAGKN